MRIAFISYELPPDTVGGIGTYVSHASRMLAARGHDVTVLAGTPHGQASESRLDGVTVHRVPCPDRRRFHAEAVPRLAAAHAARPFDVVEVPDLYAEGAGVRAAMPDIALVVRAHTPSFIAHEIDFHALPAAARGLWAARRVIGGLAGRRRWADIAASARARLAFRESFDFGNDPERAVAMQADLVAPPSIRLAARLESDWRIPPERIRVVPYPHLAAAQLLRLPVPTEARTVAFHGGVRYFKGVHVLLDAMRIVMKRRPDARLLIAGAAGPSPVPRMSPRAWWRDRMLEWQDTLEWVRPRLEALGERVTVTGFVPPALLHTHLAEADICVFPSLFDNFPNACLEAMAAARPIVATRSGGMEEMIGDDGGLLVPPGDAARLAEAILRLMGDASLRASVARRARERLLSLYSPAVIGPLHEALYEEARLRRARAGA